MTSLYMCSISTYTKNLETSKFRILKIIDRIKKKKKKYDLIIFKYSTKWKKKNEKKKILFFVANPINWNRFIQSILCNI